MQTDPQNLVANQKKTDNPINCPCSQISNSKLILCPSCGKSQHQECIKDILKMRNYQCPSCQLKESDFFIKPIYNILQPTLIKNEKIEVVFKREFQVNSDFGKFTQNLLINNTQKKNFNYVMIRCLRLDREGYEHHWPYNCSIYLNNNQLKSLLLPKNPPRSRSRVDYPLTFYFKVEDIANNYHSLNNNYSFLLNKLMCLQPFKKNTLEIKIDFPNNDNDVYSYVLSIDLVELLKDKEDVIKNISVVNDVKTLMSYVNVNINEAEDFQMNVKINLIDSYTNSKRIKIPARSFNCKHLSVFDLGFFLDINRKNKSYQCPVCKTKATRVYIDGFFVKYLKDNPNSSEVVMSPNYQIGGKLFVKEQGDTAREENGNERNNNLSNLTKVTPNKKFRSEIHVIDLEIDSEDIREKSSPVFHNENLSKNQNRKVVDVKGSNPDKKNGSNDNVNGNKEILNHTGVNTDGINSPLNNLFAETWPINPLNSRQSIYDPILPSNSLSSEFVSNNILSNPLTTELIPSNNQKNDNSVNSNANVSSIFSLPRKESDKLLEENKERDSSGNDSTAASKHVPKKTKFKVTNEKINTKANDNSTKKMSNNNNQSNLFNLILYSRSDC